MSEAHARLGPSNHRWPNCPGSVREEEQYEDIAGAAAIDGTGSHLLLEMCLKNNTQAHVYDQQIIGANHEDNPNGWLVDVERIERVQMALDYVRRRHDELKQQFPGCSVTVLPESKADPGGAFGRTDWWGTCDITIIARHAHSGEVYFVEVVDYKDGRGYVNAKDNTQLLSYLFGMMRPYIASGPDKVRPFVASRVGGCRMTIVQPKTNPVIRYQCSTVPEDNFSVGYVIDKAVELSTAAAKTDRSDAELIPGKHCQWCKANLKRGGHCTAESQQSIQVVETMSNIDTTGNVSLFEQLNQMMADPKSLSEEQLAQLADAEAGVQAIFDKIKTEMTERISQGIDIPGYAMVPSKATRKWNEDEDTIVKKLKGVRLKLKDIYPPKLISPAQLEKLDCISDQQKERLIGELVSTVAGKSSLKKVRENKVEKTVAQSSTDGVSSVEMMFGDVANQQGNVIVDAEPEQEVSFF